MFSLTWSPGITLDQLERHAIEQAFRFYQGNKTQTARALDIAIRTLEVKLEKYAFDDERAKEAFETGRLQREEFQRRQRGIASGGSSGTRCARFPETVRARAGAARSSRRAACEGSHQWCPKNTLRFTASRWLSRS